MSNAPESAVQPATYVLPDGFTVQDLAAPDYVRPLAEAAAPMIDHCQRLLVAIARPDFDGGLELDCTKNNAMTWLDDFFETVARYEEGRVPFAAAADLLALTERLLAAEMRRYPRLRGDIQSIGQAFRRSFALWGRVLPQPRRSRKVYLRKIFASFDKIIDAICTFNSKLFASDAPPDGTRKSRRGKRPRSSLTQEHVARDFGVTRKTIGEWERNQTEDGPGNTSNEYGYYRSLRTNAALRGAYRQLAVSTRAYHKARALARQKGTRFAMSFVTFNEEYLAHNISSI